MHLKLTMPSLQVLKRSGSPKEQLYANRIAPVRAFQPSSSMTVSEVHACLSHAAQPAGPEAAALLACHPCAVQRSGHRGAPPTSQQFDHSPVHCAPLSMTRAAQALPIVLDRLADPFTAVVVSIVVVLVFGEVRGRAARPAHLAAHLPAIEQLS